MSNSTSASRSPTDDRLHERPKHLLEQTGLNTYVVSPLFKQVLSYDPTGQITKQWWQHRGGMAQELDACDRAQRPTRSSDSIVYSYDEVGNRRTVRRRGRRSPSSTCTSCRSGIPGCQTT